MIDHTPTIATASQTGHNLSITDIAKGTTLTGQDQTIDLNMTEAPVTTGDINLTIYHATTVAYDIHPQPDTPEDNPKGTPSTFTDLTHP